MKTIFMLLASVMIAHTNLYSQHNDNASDSVLQLYLQVKDALVNSNANNASVAAKKLVSYLEKSDGRLSWNADQKSTLLRDANLISKTTNIVQQRKHFAALSATLIGIAKKTRLSTDPVYEQYCPMENASWLSIEKSIKNPYYGTAMLTCGSVKSTL